MRWELNNKVARPVILTGLVVLVLKYVILLSVILYLELDFESTVKALKLTERAMKLMGTWPLKSSEPIFLFFSCYLLVHCTLAVIDISINLSNIEYVISCLMENIFNVVALSKMGICKIKRKSLIKFLEDIKPDFNAENYNSNEEKVAFMNYSKFSRKFVMTLLIASFGASTMYYLLSLAVNVETVLANSSYGYKPPYKVWLFFEPTNPLTYVCLCCYQALIIPCIVLGYVGTDCLFICSVLHVSGLFSALSYKIKYVLNNSTDRQRNLRQLIINHVRLIRLSESLEENYNVMILLQLIGGIMQLCIVGYDGLVKSSQGEITMILPFLPISSAISCALLIYCYMGECLITESTVFGDAFYLCEWYNISNKEKQLMHICMIRSTKQMSLTSGKFFNVSLVTYTDVLRTTMAYFSVLRTFV